jgi:hypothetical protein
MPFPQLPELPDDDPIAALRLVWDYLRDVVGYFNPVRLFVSTITISVLIFMLAWGIFGFETTLSWASDLVPLAFAVVGIIVSVKKLREEHQSAVITLIVVVGIIGTAVLHLSRTRDQATHAREIGSLRERMDSWQTQNNQLLTSLLKPAPLSSQAAELDRRTNIQKALRGEYILSHDNISPGLLAGTEFPPSEWMNKRLRELGEKWTVFDRPVQFRPANQAPETEAKVFLNVALGDDDALNTQSYMSDDPHMRCGPSFMCYAEDQIVSGPIPLDFTGKDRRRIFFSAANISKVMIQRYMITVALATRDFYEHGLSLHRIDQPNGNPTQTGVEWKQNEVQDIVPMSKSKSFVDFAVDVKASKDSTTDFALNFRIYGLNLPAHLISVPFHITR